MAELELSAMEQRVLGALMEKQVTVPSTYPMTMNALRTACNQLNSREPVTEYGENELDDCLRSLRDRGLVRFVWEGKGSRALKYQQLLVDELALMGHERALLTVLLLRGPQSAGQLKTRTERLHPFADKDEAQRVLTSLASREVPLVQLLPRQPGQQDPRWIHLLGPVDVPEPVVPARRQRLVGEEIPVDAVAALEAAGFVLLEAFTEAGEVRYVVTRATTRAASSTPTTGDQADAALVDAEGVVVADEHEAL